jgi:hypothetical protein
MENNVNFKEMKKKMMISKVLLGIGITFAVLGYLSYKLAGLGFGILFMLVGFGLAIIGGKFNNDFKNDFRDEVMIPTIQSLFPNSTFVVYMDDKRITEPFKKLGMIRRDTCERITNLLAIETGGHLLNEFSCGEYHEVPNPKGGVNTIYTYKGTEFRYDYATNIDGVVRILASHKRKLSNSEKTFLPKECTLTPEKIETGNIELDESFEIFASSQHIGFFVLNSTVIEKIKLFREKYGDFGLAITNDELFIAFDGVDRFIKLPDKVSQINEGAFKNAKDQIYEIVDMLNDIGYAISKHVEKENII